MLDSVSIVGAICEVDDAVHQQRVHDGDGNVGDEPGVARSDVAHGQQAHALRCREATGTVERQEERQPEEGHEDALLFAVKQRS
jgi:hypothetical protein